MVDGKTKAGHDGFYRCLQAGGYGSIGCISKEIDCKLYPAKPNDKPLNIVKAALKEAKKVVDVLLIDTAEVSC